MTKNSKILLAIVLLAVVAVAILAVFAFRNEEEEPVIPVVNNPVNTEEENKSQPTTGKKINRYTQMYLDLLDDIMQKDEALAFEAEFISLDVASLDKEYMDPELKGTTRVFDISDGDEGVLLAHLKQYHDDVRPNSFEELKEQGEFNEETFALDGVLIGVTNIEVVGEDDYIITMKKYRGGLAAIFPRYSVKYVEGTWNIKVMDMAIS